MPAYSTVVYLCDYQAPYGGNFIASMLCLCRSLHSRGVRVVFLFPEGAKDRLWCRKLAEYGIEIRFLSRNITNFGALRVLLHLIDETNASILHVHFGKFALAETAAILRPKLRLILHYHSDFSAGKKASFSRRVKLALKRVPELLIGKRRLAKITVSETSLAATSDCISIPNALVTERFRATRESRMDVRVRYGIKSTDAFLLLFGWSPFVKGADIAFRAAYQLYRSGRTDIVLGIVTGREVTADKMRDFLKETVGSSDDVPFLRLLEPTEDVFSYHDAADVFLSASRSETFSYALLEALSIGKVCVSSEIAGVLWAKRFPIVHWFESGNADALADALKDAMIDADSADFSSRAETAKQLVNENYGIDRWIDGILSVYEGRFPSVSRK